MRRRPSPWMGLCALALAACAVDTTPSGTATAPTDANPAPASPGATSSAAAPASEDTRVQAFLDRIYRRESVMHSFTSAEGKAIDCVDFEAEPGVQSMLAEGYSLAQIRQFGELTPEQKEYNKTARPAATAFAGDLDTEGNARACPDGSIAHERLTKERIVASGGLDAFNAQRPQKTLPPAAAPSACAYANVDHYWWTKTGWPATGNQGGSAILSITKPTVPTNTVNRDHSLSQTWLVATSDCVTQTVEAGWTVDQNLNGDVLPHVFIFATASTYGTTAGGASGCYNNNPAEGSCVPYVTTTPIASIPPLPWSAPGGVQHEIAFSTTHVGTLQCHKSPFSPIIICSETYTGWQIAMKVDGAAWQTLGYYQNSAYGTGPLAAGATGYEVGSEVYNSVASGSVVYGNPNVTMGEDIVTTPMLQTALYGSYAYVRNYSIVGSNGAAAEAPEDLVGVGAVHETCAAFGTCIYNTTGTNYGTPGSPSWSNWYWYGDNQNLIW